MKRWHEDHAHTVRQWRKHFRFHVQQNLARVSDPVGRDPWEVDCVCDKQVGRFRKRRAWDCGRARCQLCHEDKFPKRQKTLQERRAQLTERDGWLELHES